MFSEQNAGDECHHPLHEAASPFPDPGVMSAGVNRNDRAYDKAYDKEDYLGKNHEKQLRNMSD